MIGVARDGRRDRRGRVVDRTNGVPINFGPGDFHRRPRRAPPPGHRNRRAAIAGSGADSRAAPAGCGTSLREVRLEPETRNSRGRTARPPGCSGHGGRCGVSFRGSHGHRTARGARPAAHAWSTPSSPDAGVTPDLDLSTAAAVDNLQRWPTS